MCIGKGRQYILIDGIHWWIGKDDVPYPGKFLIAQPLYVIARDDAYGTQICQAERLHQIAAESLRGDIEEPLPLLYKDSFDSHRNPPPLIPFPILYFIET